MAKSKKQLRKEIAALKSEVVRQRQEIADIYEDITLLEEVSAGYEKEVDLFDETRQHVFYAGLEASSKEEKNRLTLWLQYKAENLN